MRIKTLNLLLLLASSLLISGCGNQTKVIDYRNIEPISDIKFSMIQDTTYANRLRIALQQTGLKVTSVHASTLNNLIDKNIKPESGIDYYLKFTFELNRPCLAPPSLLGTGTVDIISAKNNQVMMQIQEEGFDEACLGTYAFYGNLFEELADSIKDQVINKKL